MTKNCGSCEHWDKEKSEESIDYAGSKLSECKELNPWLTIDEFEKEANEGWCFIFYKGRVTEAYHDHNGMYRFDKFSTSTFLRECISHVQIIERPQPPNEEKNDTPQPQII